MFILSNMGKDQEFLEAARNGNITVVEKILNQKAKRSGPLASLRRGPGANVQDSSGYSALHHAALNGHTDIVRLLLAHDASPNLPDTRGSSPLHLAAWAGHQDIVKLFLTNSNRPANPNLQTIEHETPLHCAAQHGHTGALTTLLAHGADPNVMNSRNETPLDLAAQYGRLQAVQMLIRAHPELLLPFRIENTTSESGRPVVFDHTPLHSASRNGHKGVVEVLLAAGVNVNVLTSSGTALHESALCGKDTIVRTLLDAGADLDATDCEGRTALDILEEFPPHVTKGIVSVINNHRNSMAYDSESDDVRDNQVTHKNYTTPMSLGSSYENNRGSPVQNYFNSQYDITTSPSSSIGSLGPSSPSSRPRASTGDLPEYYITMTPVKQRKPTAPKKPPRRNLSVSPTHLQPHNNSASMNERCGEGSLASDGKKFRHTGAYEYIYMSRTGKKSEDKMNRTLSADEYVEMSAPKPAPRNIVSASYENTTFKSYNPNRKLKRNRNHYEPFSIDFNKDKESNSFPKNEYPQSPTNYQQPPTPEHPPPSALQAEKTIHDRIRPLSQEYKRRSGLHQGLMIETSTSPPEILCSSLCASSGSISSSVSISDRSVSTDCVEEFIGDVPFAGLFKGSTMNLNNSFSNYGNEAGSQDNQERPKTLHPSQQYQDSYKQCFQRDYQKNRSHSFGGILDDYNDGNTVTLSSPSSSISGRSGVVFNNSNQHCRNRTERLKSDGIQDVRLIQQQYNDEQREKLRKQLQNDFKSYLSKSAKKDNKTNHYGGSGDAGSGSGGGVGSGGGGVGGVGSGGDCENGHVHQNNSISIHGRSKNEDVLSPFDEQEAWAKISEIMESFGSGILTTTDKYSSDKNTINNGSENIKICQKLRNFLEENNLEQYETILVENGFDDIEFLNGIIDESDMTTMNIPSEDRVKLLDIIKKLPIPKSLPILHNNNNNTILNVDQWLQSIHLSEYINIFKEHLYTNMEGICRVWEVELQTVLEINKLGHRKRILYSVSSNRVPSIPSFDELNADLNTLKANIMELRDDFMEKLPPGQSNSGRILPSGNGAVGNRRYNNKKNRPAPKPPTRGPAIEIRAPSELLLGLPSNLQTQWRHPANSLINGAVKYDAYYLGSTVVKELRGTESTRKSIQKLKRDDRLSISTTNINQQSLNVGSLQQQQQQQTKKQPVRLSISHRGVEFIDIESQKTICEHAIRNINCACQDADDLSHFAYITKDSDINTHYCHVFNVDSMDLATEIILTLGQAFEVAYQLALRDISSSAVKKSLVSGCRTPK